jgi:ATP-binding cassette subfamily F protein 3
VLILDEPTNHLDLESREALEDALSAFRGSLILVSHDRALLDAVGTRTIAVERGTLRSYVGGWPEYVRVREERKAAGEDLGLRPRRRSDAGSAPAGGASTAVATPNVRSRRPRRRWSRSSRSCPTRRHGRPSTRRRRTRRATPPPSGPSRPPTRSSKRCCSADLH